MHQFTNRDDAFLITSPTYKVMNQSTLPAFLKLMEGRGRYLKGDQEFEMYGGGRCYFRTNTDPDSIVGITNVRHIWGDEAGKFSLYFWENMQGRGSFKDCQIDLTTSPYAMNWIFKEIIRPKLRDPSARPDVFMVQARSDENPYFPMDEYLRRKATMDPRRFNMMYGGQWDKMAGLVYDCFDEFENSVKPFPLPAGTRFVAGIDWGFTQPFALTIRAISPAGMHYQVSEVYKAGLTMSDKIEVAKRLKGIWNITMFWCDPAEPGSIQEFQNAGLPAAPAINDVRVGIDAHYDLIASGRYKVFEGACPKTVDEYEAYHYPEPDDLKPDQDEKDAGPVKQNDHAMDSNRYITVMERNHTLNVRRPTVAGGAPKDLDKMDQEERREILTRGRKLTSHGESWE